MVKIWKKTDIDKKILGRNNIFEIGVLFNS